MKETVISFPKLKSLSIETSDHLLGSLVKSCLTASSSMTGVGMPSNLHSVALVEKESESKPIQRTSLGDIHAAL